MKIALVTDDGKTISQHFGRAAKYAVYTIEDGKIVGRELRDKVGHHVFVKEEQVGEGHHHDHGHHHDGGQGHGFGKHSSDKHNSLFANIKDCDIVVARGMGRGAYMGMQQNNLRPILTDIPEIEAAVQAVIDGTIVDHTEKLH